ncbi:MAG: hypothetical protein ACI8UO_006389, partial [Verrucomicrobiales bacterium]
AARIFRSCGCKTCHPEPAEGPRVRLLASNRSEGDRKPNRLDRFQGEFNQRRT